MLADSANSLKRPQSACGWLVLTALLMEARAIAAAFGKRVQNTAELKDGSALMLAPRVALQLIGLRASHLRRDRMHPTQRLILAGVGGGLDPAREAADVVIEFPADLRLNAQHLRAQHLRAGTFAGHITSSDRVITTPAGKEELFRATGAMAVDMESQHVREVALEANLPLWIVRGISDAATEALPADAISWVNDWGEASPVKVAAGLARNPFQIHQLMKLGANTSAASRAMAQAVLDITDQPLPMLG